MVNEEIGIKDTKEAIVAGFTVAALMISRLKDGLQLGEDVGAIFGKWASDEAFKAEVKAGIDGAGNIPAEISNLNFEEGIELAGVAVAQTPKIVAALRS